MPSHQPISGNLQEILVAGPFTLAPTLLARRDLTRIASRYWWCPAIAVAACLTAGLSDWRWIVVALTLIFVLIPTAAMFAWFAILSRPDVVSEIHPHTVSLTHNDEIIVKYLPLPDPGDADTSSSPGKIPLSPHSLLTIHTKDLTGIHIDRKYIVISYNTRPIPKQKEETELLIPIDSFGSENEAVEFFKKATALTYTPNG